MTSLDFQRRDLTEEVRAASNGGPFTGRVEPSGWEPPVPFDDCDVPAFPVEVFPRWLADFVAAAAEALQVPVDLPAMLGFSVLSLAAAKKFKVEVKPGWLEPANLYVLIALAPGEGKSPAFRAMAAPIYEHERAERERLQPAIAAATAEMKLAEDRVKVLRGRAAKAKPQVRAELEREHAEAAAALKDFRIPFEPRLVVDDATPEAIAVKLHEQGGRLGVLSAEGGPLEIIAGRYSDSPNLEIMLKAHSGDYCAVDRIGRLGFVLNAPALTLGLTVQPEVLRGLANKPGFRGRGLLGRFMYAVPRSLVGSRVPDPPPIPPSLRMAYTTSLDRLLCLPTENDEHGEVRPCVIALDDDARRMLLAAKGELEPRLARGADLHPIADWANKLPGTIARLALLLYVADRPAPAAQGTAVDGPTMARALRVGEYLVAHAAAAFGAMGADPMIDDARHALAWIKRNGQRVVSQRDLYRNMPTVFPKAESVLPAIAILEEHGYLRPQQPDPRDGAGRRRSPAYEVHPNL